MPWHYRLLLVLIIISLTIMGLNISNQGVNQLTMENRGAVVGINLDEDNIDLELMGKSYNSDAVLDCLSPVAKETKIKVQDVRDYFSKMRLIFEVLFL